MHSAKMDRRSTPPGRQSTPTRAQMMVQIGSFTFKWVYGLE
jgi:hypothetical protein